MRVFVCLRGPVFGQPAQCSTRPRLICISTTQRARRAGEGSVRTAHRMDGVRGGEERIGVAVASVVPGPKAIVHRTGQPAAQRAHQRAMRTQQCRRHRRRAHQRGRRLRRCVCVCVCVPSPTRHPPRACVCLLMRSLQFDRRVAVQSSGVLAYGVASSPAVGDVATGAVSLNQSQRGSVSMRSRDAGRPAPAAPAGVVARATAATRAHTAAPRAARAATSTRRPVPSCRGGTTPAHRARSCPCHALSSACHSARVAPSPTQGPGSSRCAGMRAARRTSSRSNSCCNLVRRCSSAEIAVKTLAASCSRARIHLSTSSPPLSARRVARVRDCTPPTMRRTTRCSTHHLCECVLGGALSQILLNAARGAWWDTSGERCVERTHRRMRGEGGEGGESEGGATRAESRLRGRGAAWRRAACCMQRRVRARFVNTAPPAIVAAAGRRAARPGQGAEGGRRGACGGRRQTGHYHRSVTPPRVRVFPRRSRSEHVTRAQVAESAACACAAGARPTTLSTRMVSTSHRFHSPRRRTLPPLASRLQQQASPPPSRSLR